MVGGDMKCGTCAHWTITTERRDGGQILSPMGKHGFGYCAKGEKFEFYGALSGCVRGRYQRDDESNLERREVALKTSRERLCK